MFILNVLREHTPPPPPKRTSFDLTFNARKGPSPVYGRRICTVSDLSRQVETLTLTCENYKQTLDEKERELVKSVQAVRDEQWQKQHMRDRMKELAEAKEAAEKEAVVARYVTLTYS